MIHSDIWATPDRKLILANAGIKFSVDTTSCTFCFFSEGDKDVATRIINGYNS